MQNIIFGIISFLIADFSFGFGAIKLFKKKIPLYLQMIVCAAGCFAIEQLSYVVNLWCGVAVEPSVGMFGIFGCNFFLLSANFGTLDRIVDDGNGSKTARRVAIIAPLVLAVLDVIAFLSWKDRSMLSAVIWFIMLLPALPASYFNLKHILLPVDPFEILKATRNCNISALVFYAVTAAFVISSASFNYTAGGIFSILMSLSVMGLSLCAVKGAKKWGI